MKKDFDVGKCITHTEGILQLFISFLKSEIVGKA